MHKLLRNLILAAAAAFVAPAAASAELTVKIAAGRATVIARDVPLRQILAEWARVGNARIVNAEKLLGGPITLELIDLPEKEALDILLRSAAGYLAAPRPDASTGGALYDRVVILATSRPPPPTASAPPQPFNRPVIQRLPAQPAPDDEDDGEPEDDGPVPPPGMMQPGMPFPGPMPVPAGANPNDPQEAAPQAPITSPRPGMLPPPPQPTPMNPYAPGPRPGGRGVNPGISPDGGPE